MAKKASKKSDGSDLIMLRLSGPLSNPYAAGQDLFSSWERPIRRYENQDGGGLLIPITETDESDRLSPATHANSDHIQDGGGR